MNRWMKILLSVVGVAILAGAVFLVPTLWFKPWSINHFYARIFLHFALSHPMMLSQVRILEPMGLDFHNDDLDDFSVEFEKREARWVDRQLEILQSYDRDSMDESQRLSTDVLEWFLLDIQSGTRFMFHGYPVNQLFGIQSHLPDFMINTHQINESKDAENYLARISKFGTAIDQVLEGLRIRESMGIIPPRFVIGQVLKEMKDFSATPVTENPLYTQFAERVDGLGGVKPAERDGLKDRLRAGIEGVVYPAYGRLIDYFVDLESVATTDDGVWKLPDGEAYYAQRLRSSTTTEMTAEQIHQLGLKRVGEIRAEMQAILEGEKYVVSDLAATIHSLSEEDRFRYPDTDEGRQAILSDYQAIIEDIDRNLDAFFDVRPSSSVTVERIPEFKEETSPLAYYQDPPMDGSMPGRFFTNLRDVKEHLRYRMRTLAYHEAIPGHHFQTGIAQELTDLPFFRRVIPFTAYTEGWALYTETLAAERGFLDDPFDRLGYLIDQQLRAVRLVVDTGIHTMRWTRRQAIDYMLEQTGMPESEVVAEIDRYIVMPGQACAYMVGQLKILELRQRAKDRLGSRFDIRGFHKVVLINGAVPLDILERLVDRWIESEGRGAGG